MLVRATELCFVDGHRRRAGAEFDYKSTPLPYFLVPVKVAPAKVEAKQPEPATLGELAANENKPKSFVESVSKRK